LVVVVVVVLDVVAAESAYAAIEAVPIAVAITTAHGENLRVKVKLTPFTSTK
jgi:hypothetical protein